jgi:hydrogenase maturation protease
MNAPRVLVAGIGNVFLGDDAFGVRVLRELEADPPWAEVRRADFGIRGFDLALELLRGYELVVLVDAASFGRAPGTLYMIEPEGAPIGEGFPEPHALAPDKVLALARSMGARWKEARVVGCEPASFEPRPEGGLTSAVEAAVAPAAKKVRELVERFLAAGTCHA